MCVALPCLLVARTRAILGQHIHSELRRPPSLLQLLRANLRSPPPRASLRCQPPPLLRSARRRSRTTQAAEGRRGGEGSQGEKAADDHHAAVTCDAVAIRSDRYPRGLCRYPGPLRSVTRILMVVECCSCGTYRHSAVLSILGYEGAGLLDAKYRSHGGSRCC